MPRCSAACCRNMGSHTFPKDPHLRSLWEKATNKENFKASKHSRLCYDHFTQSDYVDVCLSTGMTPFHKYNRYLKKTAVPSIFHNNTNQQSTSAASIIEARTSSRQQISRHLKKGVVPSIFPWTKNSATASDATQEQKPSRLQHKRKSLKKGAVPTLFIFSKQEAPKSKSIKNESKNVSTRANNEICDVYPNRNENIIPTSYHVCTPDLGYGIVVPEATEEANVNMKMSVDTSKGGKCIQIHIKHICGSISHFKNEEKRFMLALHLAYLSKYSRYLGDTKYACFEIKLNLY